MFRSPLKESSLGPIEIQDTSPAIFTDVLSFFYDRMDLAELIQREQDFGELFVAAGQILAIDLQIYLAEYLLSTVDIDNALALFRLFNKGIPGFPERYCDEVRNFIIKNKSKVPTSIIFFFFFFFFFCLTSFPFFQN